MRLKSSHMRSVACGASALGFTSVLPSVTAFFYLTRRDRLGGSKREHADSKEDKQVGGISTPPT
jgi:hypothetical protein